MDQVTTLTFFQYQGFKNQYWGFTMMQNGHQPLQEVPGQQFYKLMGTGRSGGFNPWPDWSVYAQLQVWESLSQAKDFFRNASIMQTYSEHSEMLVIYMKNLEAKGYWSGVSPFEPASQLTDIPYVASITRARIRNRELIPFWSSVPSSQKALWQNEGLLFTKGMAEVPVVQLGTFSLWKNAESLRAFAYGSAGHQKVIKKTRKRDWYKEELFARFQPFRIEGTWKGQKLIPHL